MFYGKKTHMLRKHPALYLYSHIPQSLPWQLHLQFHNLQVRPLLATQENVF